MILLFSGEVHLWFYFLIKFFFAAGQLGICFITGVPLPWFMFLTILLMFFDAIEITRRE